MGEKRIVYSVSSGEYSDYQVEVLFEDRVDAEANAARHPGWYVEEFDLHPPGTTDLLTPRRRFSARAWVNSEGRINDEVTVHDWYEHPDTGPERTSTAVTTSKMWPIRLPNGVRSSVWHDAYDVYEVSASADDGERARKAARERAAKVAAVIAEGGTPRVAGDSAQVGDAPVDG